MEQVATGVHGIEADEARVALERDHERSRLALRAARAGAWSWDRASNQATWSPENYALMGYVPGECEACYENWIARVHADDRPATEASVVHAMQERTELNVEFRVVWPDGSIHWLNDVGRMVFNAEGEPVGMYGIQIDITDRKRAEEALRALNAELEARVVEQLAQSREKDHLLIQQSRLAAMGQMLNNIAHQWRQPLNSLAILLANVEDAQAYGELDAAYLRRQVETGHALIERMSGTIEDFRRFFLPNREPQVFRASAAVRDALAIVGPAFAQEGIEIVLDVRDDPPVRGFANEYTQVVLNLLGNAKDAVEARGRGDGKVVLIVDREGTRARLLVRDNGGGIPDAVLPRIFEPYFSTRVRGTGIGLYMSRMIVATNMAGTIEARNTDAGAEVVVRVPALAAQDEPIASVEGTGGVDRGAATR
jgi:PAS domain S-box-containing protein